MAHLVFPLFGPPPSSSSSSSSRPPVSRTESRDLNSRDALPTLSRRTRWLAANNAAASESRRFHDNGRELSTVIRMRLPATLRSRLFVVPRRFLRGCRPSAQCAPVPCPRKVTGVSCQQCSNPVTRLFPVVWSGQQCRKHRRDPGLLLTTIFLCYIISFSIVFPTNCTTFSWVFLSLPPQ